MTVLTGSDKINTKTDVKVKIWYTCEFHFAIKILNLWSNAQLEEVQAEKLTKEKPLELAKVQERKNLQYVRMI